VKPNIKRSAGTAGGGRLGGLTPLDVFNLLFRTLLCTTLCLRKNVQTLKQLLSFLVSGLKDKKLIKKQTYAKLKHANSIPF